MTGNAMGRWWYETMLTSLAPLLLFGALAVWISWKTSATGVDYGIGDSIFLLLVGTAGYYATGWSTGNVLESRMPSYAAGRDTPLGHREVRRITAPRRQLFSGTSGNDLRDAVVGLAAIRQDRPIAEVGPPLWKRMDHEPWPQRLAEAERDVSAGRGRIVRVAAALMAAVVLASAVVVVAFTQGWIELGLPWAMAWLAVAGAAFVAVGTGALIRDHAVRLAAAQRVLAALADAER